MTVARVTTRRSRRSSSSAAAHPPTPPPSTSPPPANAASSISVTFDEPFGAHGLTLDVYAPAARPVATGDAPAPALAPLVVYLHGGGWKIPAFQRPLGRAGDVGRSLARRGFVVASARYRLSRAPRPLMALLHAWWSCVFGGAGAALLSRAFPAAAARAAAALSRAFPAARLPFAAVAAAALFALATALDEWRRRRRPLGLWPTHAEDAAEAVAHVVAHAARFGADACRVAVLGHSAGAHVALMLAVDPRFFDAAGAAAGIAAPPLQDRVCGIVGLSGVYSAELLEGREGGLRALLARLWYLRAAFGPDASAWSASFPVGYLRSMAAACHGAADGGTQRPPVLLTNAAPGRDWGLHEHTDLLEPLLRAAGFSVSRLELADCGHVSSLAGVGMAGAEGEEVLVPRVAEWLVARL